MLSLQTMFNKIAKHLLKQGRAATSDDGQCLYRDPHGNMCAVGCLIPERQYHEDMEASMPRARVFSIAAGGNVKYRQHEFEFLQDCQSAHDEDLCYEGMQAWAIEMLRLAGKYNLIAPNELRAAAEE